MSSECLVTSTAGNNFCRSYLQSDYCSTGSTMNGQLLENQNSAAESDQSDSDYNENMVVDNVLTNGLQNNETCESPRYEPCNGVVQPRVIAPPGKPTRYTNQLEYLQKEVLKAILKHKHSWPFAKPVDSLKLNLPDYHNRITKPMDLGTIEKRLKNCYYYSASQCMQDFRLVFSNCYAYNPTEHDITLMCRNLENIYKDKVARMPVPEAETPRPSPFKRGRSKKQKSLAAARAAQATRATNAFLASQKQTADSSISPTGDTQRPSFFTKDSDQITSSLPKSHVLRRGVAAADSTVALKPKVEKGVKRLADTTTPFSFNEPVNDQTSSSANLPVKRESSGRPVKKLLKDYSEELDTFIVDDKQKPRGKMTEQLKYCLGICKELLSKRHMAYAIYFAHPVDSNFVPDYYNVIKNPMDLGTIKKKLENREYFTPAEFASDMQLIFSNCLKYNGPDHEITKQMRKLKEVFDVSYANMPEVQPQVQIQSLATSSAPSPTLPLASFVTSAGRKSKNASSAKADQKTTPIEPVNATFQAVAATDHLDDDQIDRRLAQLQVELTSISSEISRLITLKNRKRENRPKPPPAASQPPPTTSSALSRRNSAAPAIRARGASSVDDTIAAVSSGGAPFATAAVPPTFSAMPARKTRGKRRIGAEPGAIDQLGVTENVAGLAADVDQSLASVFVKRNSADQSALATKNKLPPAAYDFAYPI